MTLRKKNDLSPTLKKILNGLGQCLIGVIIYYAISSYQQRHLITTGTLAPAFHLPQLQQKNWFDSNELAEKTSIIYFFAPWCQVCKLSASNLNTLDKQKLNVIMIALDYQHIEEVSQFVEELDLSMPILLGNDALKQQFNISAYPTYYVLDQEQRIIGHSMGYSTELGLKLRSLQ